MTSQQLSVVVVSMTIFLLFFSRIFVVKNIRIRLAGALCEACSRIGCEPIDVWIRRIPGFHTMLFNLTLWKPDRYLKLLDKLMQEEGWL